MSSVSNVRLGEFETFLYAPIGQDNEGMPLSVLSALARRDVDPWQLLNSSHCSAHLRMRRWPVRTPQPSPRG